MSLVTSLNIAQQALSVSQAAITVISNNIANVDTEGYSKLRVNQADVVTNIASSGNKISMADACSGVTISSIERYSNSYLQKYYWQQNSSNSYLNEYASVATNIEDVVNELNDTGLSAALSSFYEAADSLNNAPSDITARQNYVNAANNVASAFNSISTNLNNIKISLVGNGNDDGTLESSDIVANVNNVNSLLDQLAEVNTDIINTSAGGSASASSYSLMDKRDSLITKLTDLIPVNVTENKSGTVNIALGNYNLVQGGTIKGHLDVSVTGDPDDPVSIDIIDPENPATPIASNVNSLITGGSIGAILGLCGSDANNLSISNMLNDLDKMANTFAAVLNEIQTGDPNLDGTTAMAIDGTSKTLIPAIEDMFVANGGGVITAANIQVNSTIVGDPYLIAAARVTNPADPNVLKQIGNNANSLLVLNSRNNSNLTLGSTTFEKYLSNIISTVGTKVDNINGNLTSQTAVLNQVKNNLQSETGVNLDEELSELIKYQRAYQAGARIFSICNDIFETLVNLGR